MGRGNPDLIRPPSPLPSATLRLTRGKKTKGGEAAQTSSSLLSASLPWRNGISHGFTRCAWNFRATAAVRRCAVQIPPSPPTAAVKILFTADWLLMAVEDYEI